LTSPLTNTACVYYRSLVCKHVRDGAGARWEPIFEKSQGCDFVLEDDEGRVNVEFEMPELGLTEETQVLNEVIEAVKVDDETRLAEHVTFEQGSLLGEQVSLSELILGDGHQVTVQGTCAKKKKQGLYSITATESKKVMIQNYEVI